MTLKERFDAHARDWGVTVEAVRTTETSQLGFGTRGDENVVLKVIRKEGGEEWRCGDVLEAFGGVGMIRPLVHVPGAVLLPRLSPGNDLASHSLAGRDAEATDVIASLLQRMFEKPADLAGIRSVDRLQPEFARFRREGEGVIPMNYVDRAGALFAEMCATQRDVRLVHGDLHHYNILFDEDAGWVVIDPWGVRAEVEFEVGASLRNPTSPLLDDPRVLERRLRTFEARLHFNADRALKWAFATTVSGILWPIEAGVVLDLRSPFASAARSMLALLEGS